MGNVIGQERNGEFSVSPAYVFGCIVDARTVTTGATFDGYHPRVDRTELDEDG